MRLNENFFFLHFIRLKIERSYWYKKFFDKKNDIYNNNVLILNVTNFNNWLEWTSMIFLLIFLKKLMIYVIYWKSFFIKTIQNQIDEYFLIYSTRNFFLLSHYKNIEIFYQVHQITIKTINKYIEIISKSLRFESRYVRFMFQF